MEAGEYWNVRVGHGWEESGGRPPPEWEWRTGCSARFLSHVLPHVQTNRPLPCTSVITLWWGMAHQFLCAASAGLALCRGLLSYTFSPRKYNIPSVTWPEFSPNTETWSLHYALHKHTPRVPVDPVKPHQSCLFYCRCCCSGIMSSFQTQCGWQRNVGIHHSDVNRTEG